MNEALLYTLSTKLVKALPVNSTASEYSINAVTPQVTSIVLPPGSMTMGSNGIFAPNRLLLMPFGEGELGQTFSMRLYYINHVSDDSRDWVFVTALLIEFVCTLGSLPGPMIANDPSGNQYRQIHGSDNFCQSLAATAGSYGKDGDINTDTGFPAFSLVAIDGARFVGFDFKAIDENVTMNALWARA